MTDQTKSTTNVNLLSLDLNPSDSSVSAQSTNKKNPLQIPELLTTILNNLEVAELIQLRLISIHWKSVIESICAQKHCLLLYNFERNVKFMLDRFFGEFLKSKSVATLKFRFDERFYRFLGDLFLNVDQLVIRKTYSSPDNVHEILEKYFPNVTTYSLDGQRFWPRDRLNHVASHLPIKWHLKRLDLDNNLPLVQSNVELFDQLEHFSCFQYGDDYPLDTLPPLGSKCTHFWFRCDTITDSAFQDWIERNCNSGSNLAQVTHLGLSWIVNDFDDHIANRDAFIPLICDKFESLQMLDLGWDRWGLINQNACIQLAKLTRLRTLRLRRTELDPISLKSAIPLQSIRVLHLMDVDITGVTTRYSDDYKFKKNGPIYCRILATVFPNLEELGVFSTKTFFQESFQDNLNHFTKLRHFRKFNSEFDI